MSVSKRNSYIISKELNDKATAIAKKQGKSLSSLVRELLIMYVEEEEKKNT